MKALAYQGPKHVEVVTKPDPRIEHPGDAIVRVTRAAICGSDLHLYHGLVPDTRVGHTFALELTGEKTTSGLTLTLGGRLEGTPARDLIGESRGFRRPGFAVSVEPGIVFIKNGWSASVSAPVALYRNRERSVADELTGPTAHGDAAFADYMLLFSLGKAF